MHYVALAFAVTLTACAGSLPSADLMTLKQEVIATERAFAQTMAQRDFAAFTSFLDDEAVFFSGPTPFRSKTEVAAAWKRHFESELAPFSWEPKKVEVLDSGTLALSSGPVHNAEGKLISEYTSIWRREAPGTWKIVFDKGNRACPPPKDSN